MTSLPPLVRVSDLEARLGRTFEEPEITQVEAWIEDASALVRAEAGQTWVTDDDPPEADPPDIVKLVVYRVVTRVIQNPDGLSSESAGDYSYQRNGVIDGGGIYLTEREAQMIRRAAGRSGLWTQSTTRNDVHLDIEWVSDQFGCDPIPYSTIPRW